MTASAPSTLTPEEIAVDLKVSVRLVQDMFKDGRIPAKRVGAKLWRCRCEDYELWKATPENVPNQSNPSAPEPPGAPRSRPRPTARRPLRKPKGDL